MVIFMIGFILIVMESINNESFLYREYMFLHAYMWHVKHGFNGCELAFTTNNLKDIH
jgi:hypothetical protein